MQRNCTSNALPRPQISNLLLSGCPLLSVDDLQDISALESYVDNSQCFLFFLSIGYFESANCRRELAHAVATSKPMLAVHEHNCQRGGAPLHVFREQSHEFPAILENVLIISWHRVAEFQDLSLKLIAAAVLHASPQFKSLPKPPELYVQGELSHTNLELSNAIVYVSDYNPGAKELAFELVSRFGKSNNWFRYRHQLSTRSLQSVRSIRGSIGDCSSSQFSDSTSVHAILYLNEETFKGDQTMLAKDMEQMAASGVGIVLVHENDEERGGCPFDVFLRSACAATFHDLFHKRVAIPFHAMPHRNVSFVLLAQAFGATKRGKSKAYPSLRASIPDFTDRASTSTPQSSSRDSSQQGPFGLPGMAIEHSPLWKLKAKIRVLPKLVVKHDVKPTALLEVATCDC